MELLLVSQSPFYREGVEVILQRIFRECNVHQAVMLDNLPEELSRRKIDLILIDIRISQSQSLEDALIGLRHARPEVPICMLVEPASSSEQIRAAFELGIKGYFHSGLSPEEIKRTINMALAGRVSLPDFIWKPAKNLVSGCTLLTPRQLEIMRCLEKGSSNKVIASSLNLSVATVKRHISNIFKALGSKNRIEAINTFKTKDPCC